MGYTHYWTPKEATPEQWDVVIKEAKELLDALPNDISIKGGMGTGEPEIDKKHIWLNGDEKDFLDHETFAIQPNVSEWNFCKTARKPYDLLVCAILISAHNNLGYEVTSDGRFEDWKPAIEFYLKTFYAEMPDEDGLKSILPKFLFDEQESDEYNEPYNLYGEVKTMFIENNVR